MFCDKLATENEHAVLQLKMFGPTQWGLIGSFISVKVDDGIMLTLIRDTHHFITRKILNSTNEKCYNVIYFT